MNKIYFIADLFSEDIVGGGELNNQEAIKILSEKFLVIKRRSHTVDMAFLLNNKNCLFIIGNFINLNKQCLQFIQENLKYIIYEHDHKYLVTRNPAHYDNFVAPKNHIVNFNFYKNAKLVIAQSKLHKEIIDKNLNLDNVYNFSGNLWCDETLNYIEKINKCDKEEICSILDSVIQHKNTQGAIDYCTKNNLVYRLIQSQDNEIFLNLLSKNKKFVFLPKTPETLSRVCVEAKMLNVQVVTTKLTGAVSEDWFKKSGDEIIAIMRSKKKEFLKLIEQYT